MDHVCLLNNRQLSALQPPHAPASKQRQRVTHQHVENGRDHCQLHDRAGVQGQHGVLLRQFHDGDHRAHGRVFEQCDKVIRHRWYDQPERKWNAFENYFPGMDYCDWVAISAYGPLTPRTNEGLETFRFEIDEAYPRLTKIAPDKPVIVAEFGCDLHNPHVDVVKWTRSALDDLFSNRWPAIAGFCWWNEGWQNDDVKKHDTDMIVLHDIDLTHLFRGELAQHRDKIQETPVIKK